MAKACLASTLGESQGYQRAIAFDPGNERFCTGSADRTIKIWDSGTGQLKLNLTGHIEQVQGMYTHRIPAAIVNCMFINEDNVMVSAGDNGSWWFWDYKSGHNFQQAQTIVQPGLLDSEAGIYALSYDQTGSRLIPCEADKSIKFWKEDETATPESHPVLFRPPKDMRRF